MKPIRYTFAFVVSRLTIIALRILGRNGTHFPGAVAMRLCPDFIKHLPQPKKLIAITGTNGKTTVTNLVSDVLKNAGYTLSNNAMGSNIQEGIIVTAILASSFFGNKSIVDVVVLEVDERISPRIYPYLKPDILIVTNLFRDSYRRNAHVEFIQMMLEQAIPSHTQLIVNADDPISSFICPGNPRISFSLQALEHEEQIKDSRIVDLIYCPKCQSELVYDFQRYHHIGQVHCPNCDFKSMKADLEAIVIDQKLRVQNKDQSLSFDVLGDNPTDHYNLLASIALFNVLGFDLEAIQMELSKLKIVKTRFDQVEVKGKQITIMMTKDQNPIATSRIFDYIRHQSNRKSALILINENSEHHSLSENNAWYYDTDFEYLKKDHILQIIGGGHRILDLKVKLALTGIPLERYQSTWNELDTAKLVDLNGVDAIYILNGTKNIPEAKQIRKHLIERIEAEVQA